MFVENIKYIQEAERKAKDILDKASQKGKDLLKKNEQDLEKSENELKESLQAYSDKKIKDASQKAEKEIEKLKDKNKQIQESIQKHALSLLDETGDFVFQKLLTI